MNKHVFLPITLLLLFLSLNTFGQRSDKRVYTDSGWWTLGLTGGAAYQGSDICAIPGWGAGIDLAKNIYHRPNGLLDVDLRGRLLYTQTYGADHERSYGILENPALNGTNNPILDYTAPNGPGYTFMNHKTHLGELSLEGVLTANRLRENTGVILQGFGGLGINGYQSFTDQLRRNYSTRSDEMRDWDGIDTDRRRWDILNQIGTYGYHETPAHDYDNAPRISVMPSLGLGLGYQLTRNFSIGLEHKTNWALHDNLEGQQYNREDNTLSTNNDLHHYTSLYLRFRFGKKEKYDYMTEEEEEEDEPIIVSSTGGVNDMPCPMPIVSFYRPGSNSKTVDEPYYEFKATVENIENRDDIKVLLNGYSRSDFRYLEATDKLSITLKLKPGANKISITATNDCGKKDIVSRIINYKSNDSLENGVTDITTEDDKPMPQYPKVRITYPTGNPYSSEEQNVTLRAEVENVSSKNDITFKVNGRRTDNFDFGYFDNTITADIRLETGTNDISITVKNADGSDTDRQKIRFEEQVCTVPAPRVRISSPSANPYNSTESIVPVTAKIENIENKNDITFTVNGQRKTNFNYSTSSDRFTANVALNGERTEVVIRATNLGGTDSDDLTIVYCPAPVLLPQVIITKPMNNPHNTRSGSERVTATVTNVDSKADINVKINNQPILDFNYSNSRNEVTFNANLKPGNNTIDIRATNSAGNDRDDVVIQYNAIERPEVDITKPSSDPYTSPNSSVIVIATVKNVDSKSDVKFKVNGRTTNNFNYSQSSGRVTATVNLENGNNTIYIKATNEAGSDSDDTVVRYNEPTRPVSEPDKPVNTVVVTPTVKITQPHESPFTVRTTQVAILATIKNVRSKRDITFTVNGKTIRNFDYNANRNAFEGVITLGKGENNIVITARNGDKTASDDTVLIYSRSGDSQDQFGDTYNDDDDDGGNKTSTSGSTKSGRSRLSDLLKGKKDEDAGSKKSPRGSRGNK